MKNAHTDKIFYGLKKREREVPIPKFLQIESIYLLYKSFRLRSDEEAAENEKILVLHKY